MTAPLSFGPLIFEIQAQGGSMLIEGCSFCRDKHDKNHRPQFHKVGNMDWLATAWFLKARRLGKHHRNNSLRGRCQMQNPFLKWRFLFLLWEPAVGVPKTMITVLNRFRIGEGSGDQTPYGRWLVEKHFLEIMLLFWWPRYGKVC